MTNVPESGEVPDDASKPARGHRPRRGAFPTPKSEIDKAQPYIPASGDEDDPERKSEQQPEHGEGER
jgi:hypothetical protein